jgi:mannose-6-phosphate isomerase-like protein (cupin superfamily)
LQYFFGDVCEKLFKSEQAGLLQFPGNYVFCLYNASMQTEPMFGHKQSWTAAELIEKSRLQGGDYLQLAFNSGQSMSVVTVKSGPHTDPQETNLEKSHDADELYAILRGQGKLCIWGKDHEVGPGTFICVPASAPHFFHSVSGEHLIALAVLGPRNSVRSHA